MNEITRNILTGERAAFGSRDTQFTDCIFEDGESPLKESRDIRLEGCAFRWKYPLWYCRNVIAERTNWHDGARAGVWYTENMILRDAIVQAPKNFRRCQDLTLERVALTNAEETLWSCRNVTLRDVTAKGPYFAMNCENVTVENLFLDGNYSFDGAKNVVIRHSRLLSKDSFWNSEDVTVYDSYIYGEYLGWNARNLTLVNCTVESLQGFCYIENLKLVNCKLVNTTLAFEYSSVDAEIDGSVDSVLNPASGTIRASRIGELIMEADKVEPSKTKIIVRDCK